MNLPLPTPTFLQATGLMQSSQSPAGHPVCKERGPGRPRGEDGLEEGKDRPPLRLRDWERPSRGTRERRESKLFTLGLRAVYLTKGVTKARQGLPSSSGGLPLSGRGRGRRKRAGPENSGVEGLALGPRPWAWSLLFSNMTSGHWPLLLPWPCACGACSGSGLTVATVALQWTPGAPVILQHSGRGRIFQAPASGQQAARLWAGLPPWPAPTQESAEPHLLHRGSLAYPRGPTRPPLPPDFSGGGEPPDTATAPCSAPRRCGALAGPEVGTEGRGGEASFGVLGSDRRPSSQ